MTKRNLPSRWLLVTSLYVLFWISAAEAKDRKEFLRQNPELSEFFKLADSSPLLQNTLSNKRGTLFVPNNAALQVFNQKNPGKIDNNTLIYHFCNIPVQTKHLEDMVSADLQGNPPIWVTKVTKPREGTTSIFLNDAQITKGNLVLTLGQEQVVHVIDRVLEPTAPDSASLAADLINPDAKKFLENSASYSISKDYGLMQFASQVAKLQKMDEFKTLGRHTFFIPVDEAFRPSATSIGSVDSKVIDGHMIFGKAIFLRSAELDHAFPTYQTSASAANFPVFVSFTKKVNTDRMETWSVSSENRIGNVASHHRQGIVHAVVLKGNIPVKNGVVHLISQPLVLINSPVYKILETYYDEKTKLGEKTGPMSGFLDAVKEVASEPHRDMEITNLLNGQSKITVFVPTSEALSKSTKFHNLKSNKTLLKEILMLHIVRGEIRAENISHNGLNERVPYQAETLRKNNRLYFNVIRNETDSTIFVEGGGTNASIETPDIGATNGVIHLINRVLGVEDQTMFDKLESDPMLQLTYRLTNQEGYNNNFKKAEKRFTFFAPSNVAWDSVKYKHPSEHLKLFEGSFGYQVGKLMDRHLIVGREVTIEEMRNQTEQVLSRSDYELPIRTLNGGFRVFSVHDSNYSDYERRFISTQLRQPSKVSGDFNYVIFWDNKKSFVVRPNIKCTNGIIHIIDTVLMTADDVYVNSVKNFHNANSIVTLLTFSVFFLCSRLLLH